MVEPGQTKITQFELAPVINEHKSITTQAHTYVHVQGEYISMWGSVCTHVASTTCTAGKRYMHVV